jgi:hypothetical protein
MRELTLSSKDDIREISIKKVWQDYKGDVVFTSGPLDGNQRYLKCEILTQSGLSDTIQFYSGKKEELMKFLNNPSSVEEMAGKIKEKGMFLLIEEDRRSDNDWE